MSLEFGLEKAGLFGIGMVLSPVGGDLGRAGAAAQSELQRFLADGLTEEEFEKTKNQAISRLVRRAETVSGKARLIGEAAVGLASSGLGRFPCVLPSVT